MGSSFNTKMMKALQAVARPNRETNMNSAQITQMILEADEFSLGLNRMIKTLSDYSSAANGEKCFLNTENNVGRVSFFPQASSQGPRPAALLPSPESGC